MSWTLTLSRPLTLNSTTTSDSAVLNLTTGTPAEGQRVDSITITASHSITAGGFQCDLWGVKLYGRSTLGPGSVSKTITYGDLIALDTWKAWVDGAPLRVNPTAAGTTATLLSLTVT